MNAPRAARGLLFGLVFTLSLGVYLTTLAPAVALNDSGALTLAAWSLGNAHPPGMPFYVMLTHLALRIPFGSVIWRANVSSAFFAALACAIVSLTLFELLRSWKPDRRRSDLIIAGTAGLLLAFGKTMWAYATVAEVYAMNAALIALILWLIVRWRIERSAACLYALAFVSGLALGVHYVTVAFVLIAVLLLIQRTGGWRFFVSRPAIASAAITIATVTLVYAYLPIAAARQPVLNWGDPDSLDRFIGHVTARQFRVFVGETGAGQSERANRYLFTEFGSVAAPMALAIGAWGLIHLFRRDRSLFWLLLIMAAASIVWLRLYEIIYDADAYLLPAHIALAIAFAAGAASIAQGSSRLAAVFVILPVIAAGANWKWRDRSDFRIADDFAKNTLKSVKGDSLLLTENWQLYSPLLYLLEVEKARPDVKAVLQLMLFWPWYLDATERRYPDVAAPVAAKIAEFRPQSIRYERDLDWRRAGGDARLLASFDEVVFGLIAAQLDRGGRVYLTPGILLSQDAAYSQFLPRLFATYDVVPHGMVVEIVPQGENRQPELAPIELRGLTNAAERFDPDDAVVRDVIPAYSKAFQLRARALANLGRMNESLAAYRQALALTPRDSALQLEMRRVEAAARR